MGYAMLVGIGLVYLTMVILFRWLHQTCVWRHESAASLLTDVEGASPSIDIDRQLRCGSILASAFDAGATCASLEGGEAGPPERGEGRRAGRQPALRAHRHDHLPDGRDHRLGRLK